MLKEEPVREETTLREREHLIGISQGHKLADTFTSHPPCAKYINTNANTQIQEQMQM